MSVSSIHIKISPNLIALFIGLCLYSFKKAYSLGEPIVSFNTGRPQVDSKWYVGINRFIFSNLENITYGH